jgi:hypothetical protein
MKVTLCTFMLLAVAVSPRVFGSEHKFGAEADQHCPKLPKGSGYVWEWVFSVDAGYCIGSDAKTKKEAFEFAVTRVYGVIPPGEIEPETSFVKTGGVGGTPVRWYRASRRTSSEKLAYRTFTLLNEENMAYLSVSVYAASKAQMEERLHVMERLEYR